MREEENGKKVFTVSHFDAKFLFIDKVASLLISAVSSTVTKRAHRSATPNLIAWKSGRV